MYYVTQYALSSGILLVDPERTTVRESEDGYLDIGRAGWPQVMCGPNDWCRDLKTALAQVEKAKATRRQILLEELEKLKTFSPEVKPWKTA